MKESYLYKKLDKKIVQCQTCSHYCKIIPGKRGICGVRENKDGKLEVLNYDKIIARHIDPVEKKPLFHFLPGTPTFSVSAPGCNLRCGNCQNWSISQGPRLTGEILGEKSHPEEIVKDAKKANCLSLSYTYTEPTIFLELALDTMKLARKKGLKNIWVSNGFMSKETFDLVAPYIDAINIDLKFFDNKTYQEICGISLDPVLENLKRVKSANIWLEVTTLIIPTLSDDDKTRSGIAKFIKKELGEDTPWHISAFSPEISWKMQHLASTPIQTIKRAYKIGKDAGLKYVYTGNIFDDTGENTYCPKCNETAIERLGYRINRLDKKGKCAKCGKNLNLML